ncbi:aminotransferase class I/II-fold pyridoxal phosphate-dependent enzyme [Helicobacter cholecystus]|uniref:aminotransferase class I/II-fold pyridoxal phosphate-dependent enzyme n=1 Tax=Helicobacter cholecystus TaxID=45498 RepID=UPI002739CACA|nr:pyridoxal phosphate-dependent aminotransferase family protein [Helicobacter cholecystus]
MFYTKELEIMQKAGIIRKKQIYPSSLLDYASNDYLGLSTHHSLLQQAYLKLSSYPYHSPIASQAINGYHPIHEEFEEFLKNYFGFMSATLFGSGFLANLALFETLVRKGDVIFVDELYHASGKLSAKLLHSQVVFFSHNNILDLKDKIEKTPCKNRRLIAIEGVYSMDGDLAKKEFYTLAHHYDALLIIDEAHSSGVLGDNLKGYLDYYNLPVTPNIVKMGTLSKAYGSYGAFILGEKSVIDFLFTKAKSSIYTTAPSLFDIALAHCNLTYIAQNTASLLVQLKEQKEALSPLIHTQSQLAILPYTSQKQMLLHTHFLLDQGYLIGSIRKPTSQTPRIRISLNIKNNKKQSQKLCKILQNFDK